ncbi:MAG: tRNA (adenosine(37)-N6)-threonylcarbamoyltransferase complex transferase subunit TsaD [Candidatus Harrisonbacteria bacterium CG10_big_fil_rev_8_21_14_0_10_49_15]|uniref:tRNA N6-adenosine threonylcarbamoyltransferase n=1 Tax=Candidatus Harrisonbacteria bacterium CG10_big_fil_rev_8_21_14_0_10_49_15 TaxID=1974587 RepID=A0A2H0UJR5_9BACT|nr:MAG: tRNA (adenosine(37)-N6)-threonylcarbamoyltransferase complex transferase subunit TsaD [Candidatus Harrisonbacteria bacterium CG10_big_fil_rev_8_21_14_0_10_49_15]
MRILAIETSCDETALSVVDASGGLENSRFEVLENLIISQIDVHRPWGGVVPNLAKREHQKNLPKLFTKLKERINLTSIDLVAVTSGPGLAPALWQGIEFAKKIGEEYNKPVVGANHLEGHLYSVLLPRKQDTASTKIQTPNPKESISGMEFGAWNLEFPAVALLVSGGHTILALFKSLTEYEKLGETRDDAVGEVFDKVARMLELPYPGGPEIERVAKDGNPKAIDFPRPMIHEPSYDFSFSGLKTAVLYHLRDHSPAVTTPLKIRGAGGSYDQRADIAASFQAAAVDVLTQKTLRAANEFAARSVFIGGGVAMNKALRHELAKKCQEEGLVFAAPDNAYNTDNAVMIAAAAYINHLTGKTYSMEAQPNLNL